MSAQALEMEPVVDRAYLDELVHWIKTLHAVGVSPDKASEIASDFLLYSYSSEEEGEGEYYEDEEE